MAHLPNFLSRQSSHQIQLVAWAARYAPLYLQRARSQEHLDHHVPLSLDAWLRELAATGQFKLHGPLPHYAGLGAFCLGEIVSARVKKLVDSIELCLYQGESLHRYAAFLKNINRLRPSHGYALSSVPFSTE